MTSLSKVGVTEASLNLSTDAFKDVSKKVSLEDVDKSFSAFVKSILENNNGLKLQGKAPTLQNDSGSTYKPK